MVCPGFDPGVRCSAVADAAATSSSEIAAGLLPHRPRNLLCDSAHPELGTSHSARCGFVVCGGWSHGSMDLHHHGCGLARHCPQAELARHGFVAVAAFPEIG